MSSRQLLCLLLTLSFYSTKTSAETITVSSGDSVFLPCPIEFKDSIRIGVEWKKDGQSLCKYFINNTKVDVTGCKDQFKVNTEPSGLNIKGVSSSDAGVYTCLMNKLIPPPTENRSATVRLKVKVTPSLSLELMNSTDSSCVEMICSLQGLEPQQVNFTWIRAAQVLHRHKSSNMSSFLKLCKPNWTEGETLTCQALYPINHTLYKKNITLPRNSDGVKYWLFIVVIGGGVLLVFLLVVAILKCKNRNANEAVFYRNKIYENFTFGNTPGHPASNPRNPSPNNASNIRSNTRSTPRTIRQTPNTGSQTPETIRQTLHTIRPTPNTIRHSPYTIRQTPNTISRTPNTISRTPHTVETQREECIYEN